MLIASRKAEVCEAVAQELSEIGPCEGFGGTVASEAGVARSPKRCGKRTSELAYPRQQCGRHLGRAVRALSVESVGAGHRGQRRRAVHADARDDADADRGGQRGSSRQRHQSRLGHGHGDPIGDRLRLFGVEGGGSSSDAHPRGRVHRAPCQRQRDRAGAVSQPT